MGRIAEATVDVGVTPSTVVLGRLRWMESPGNAPNLAHYEVGNNGPFGAGRAVLTGC